MSREFSPFDSAPTRGNYADAYEELNQPYAPDQAPHPDLRLAQALSGYRSAVRLPEALDDMVSSIRNIPLSSEDRSEVDGKLDLGRQVVLRLGEASVSKAIKRTGN